MKMNIYNKLKFILTKHEKNQLIGLSLNTLVLALFETCSIGIIIPIMNLFVNPGKIETSGILRWLHQLTGIKDNTNFLTVLIVAAMILFFFRSLYSVFMLYRQRKTVNNIYARLTTKVLNSYLNKPYAFHLESHSAILFRNVATIVTQLCSSFLYPLILINADIVVLLAIFCLLIYNYAAATILLGVVLIIVTMVINLFIKERIRRYSLRRVEAEEELHKTGLEALQAVKEIQVYNAQNFFIDRYFPAANKHADSHLKYVVCSYFPHHIMTVILMSAMLTALLVSIYFYKNPSGIIPMITVLGLAALRVLPSVQRIYSQINTFRYYSNTVGEVYKILKEDSQKEISEKALARSVGPPLNSEAIRLENIEFQYSRAPSSIFKDFSLVIPRHKTIAFAGETGAGKSTLIDIIMGLLTPAKGVLYYGQTPITSLNVSKYRRKIGYVPQHIFLIDDTLEANITFGISKENIDQKQLKHVIQIAQMESLVNDLPAGVKTKVGEKGVRLSGGQKQKVAIARALYRNPEILVLDEATSALDGYTEAEVSKAINSLYGKLTIIIIAHRLSTIKKADVIYVMDHGKIVDKGNFKELLENSSAFQKIANQIPT